MPSFARVLFRSACILICLAAAAPQIRPAAASSLKEACAGEMLSICPFRFTPSAISSCIATNRQKLSSRGQLFWATAQRCLRETQKVCGGANPITVNGCLKTSKSKFSRTCREHLQGR